MKDFNLHGFLRNNPLTSDKKNKSNINEAFEGMRGVADFSTIGSPIKNEGKVKENMSIANRIMAIRDKEQHPNKWINDIDRMQPEYGDWKASLEYPGIIVWSHADMPDVMVVATPGWDGPGTPIEIQFADGKSKMIKILDQDVFATYKDYMMAVKPYLDMTANSYTDMKEAKMKKEEGYMGTQYDSSEDMAVDMVKTGIREMPSRMPSRMSNRETPDQRMEGLVNRRYLAKFAEAAMMIAQDLDADGFDEQDIKRFLMSKLDDMILA